MTKFLTVCFILFLCLSTTLFPQIAYADTQQELESSVDESLGNLDFSQMEKVAGSYVGSIVDKIQEIINGEYDSLESFWQMLVSLLGDAFAGIFPQLVSIFVVLVVVGLVRKTSGGFISQSTDEVVAFVGTAVILLTVIVMVVEVYSQVNLLLAEISALTDASLPIILTLMIANGASNLSTVCQPLMVVFSGGIITLVRQVILPMSMAGIAFSFVSNLSANVRVSKMTSFLNNTASWVLGIVFTVFSAVTSVQGVSASVVDGVSFRMAKFSAKNYIPILGGYVADGFDVVVASTTLIKNAFGVVALLVLFLMVAKPLVSIICLNVGLQAVSAISQPIVEEKCSKIFGGVCKCLTFLSALVVAVCFMFCILIFIAISCANGV